MFQLTIVNKQNTKLTLQNCVWYLAEQCVVPCRTVCGTLQNCVQNCVWYLTELCVVPCRTVCRTVCGTLQNCVWFYLAELCVAEMEPGLRVTGHWLWDLGPGRVTGQSPDPAV